MLTLILALGSSAAFAGKLKTELSAFDKEDEKKKMTGRERATRTGVPSDWRVTKKSENVRLIDNYFYSSLSFFLDSWMNCHHLCSSTKRSTKKH